MDIIYKKIWKYIEKDNPILAKMLYSHIEYMSKWFGNKKNINDIYDTISDDTFQ